MNKDNNNTSADYFLEKEILNDNGSNFHDWYQRLRSVLKLERKLYVIDEPIPILSRDNATKISVDTYKSHLDNSSYVSTIILGSMGRNIMMDIGHLDAYGIITVLKKMYRPSETLDRYGTMLALQSCKMIEGESISSHYLTMKGHIDFLDKIGCALNLEVANDLILFSLPEEYKHFVIESPHA